MVDSIDPFGIERGPLPDSGKSPFALYLEGQLEIASAEGMSRYDLLRHTFGAEADLAGMDVMEAEPMADFLSAVLGAPEDFAIELDAMTPEEREAHFDDREVAIIVAAYAAEGDRINTEARHAS